MDDPLGADPDGVIVLVSVVLIPILMDDPLGGTMVRSLMHKLIGLNPYSNG